MDLLEELKRFDGDLDSFSKHLPCTLHINDPVDFSLIYLDPRTKALIGLTDDQKAYKNLTMVHPEDLPRAKKSVSHYLKNTHEYSTVSFLQRIKFGTGGYHVFYTTSMLIEELGGLVGFSVQVDTTLVQESRIDKIILETQYIQSNFEKITRLSASEIQVMKLWAKNLKVDEIADQLNISKNTVKTYKKRIYKKLEINSFYELFELYSAFDFI